VQARLVPHSMAHLAPHSRPQGHPAAAPAGGGGKAVPPSDTNAENNRLFAFLKASQAQGGVSTPDAYRDFVGYASQPPHAAAQYPGGYPQAQHHPVPQQAQQQQRNNLQQQGPSAGAGRETPWQADPSHFWQQQQPLQTEQEHTEQPQQQAPWYLPEKMGYIPEKLPRQQPQYPQQQQQQQSSHAPQQQIATAPQRQSGGSASPPKGILKNYSPTSSQFSSDGSRGRAQADSEYHLMASAPPSNASGGASLHPPGVSHRFSPSAASHPDQTDGLGGGADVQPISKGMCAVCDRPVYVHHARTKNAKGMSPMCCPCSGCLA